MKKVGKHFILDAWGCPAELINNVDLIRQVLVNAVEAGDATLIDLCTHKFSPQGITATATLAESHISIHTWPEYGYVACDLFFCGHGNPKGAIDSLCRSLHTEQYTVRQIDRGMNLAQPILSPSENAPHEPH